MLRAASFSILISTMLIAAPAAGAKTGECDGIRSRRCPTGDVLEGFGGRDFINARDHERDLRIDCGSARDRRPRRDRIDPRPIKC